MDFLLALVAPVLSKVLYFVYLSGVATSFHLQQRRRKAIRGLPPLPPQRLRSRTSFGEAKPQGNGSAGPVPRAPPNDPERQGNIWQRYEQLETTSQELTKVNQQIVYERNKYRKERKKLEDALLELEAANRAMAAQLPAGSSPRPQSPHLRSVLSNIEDINQVEGAPARAVPGQPEVLHVHSDSPQQDASMPPLGPKRSSGAQFERVQQLELTNRVLEERVRTLEGSHRPGQSMAGAVPTAFSQAEGLGHAHKARELETTIMSLEQEVAALKSALAATRQQHAGGPASPFTAASQTALLDSQQSMRSLSREPSATGAFGGGTLMEPQQPSSQNELDKLQSYGNMQMLTKRLQEENHRLQNKVLAVSSEGARISDLEDANRKLTQECTRLQSKVLRFDMGVTSVPQPLAPDSRALLDELREENGQLRDDNDKLVEYLEKLEAKLNSGANTPAAAEPSSNLAGLGSVDSLVAVKAQNRQLEGECQSLRIQLSELKGQLQSSQRSPRHLSTVQIPVVMDAHNQEAVDKDMWVALEDLTSQNRSLLSENASLKQQVGRSDRRPGPGESSTGQASEVERLQRELAAVKESRAAEINQDNIRLVNHLTEETAQLQADVLKLSRKLASGDPNKLKDGEIMREVLMTSERMSAEKNKMAQEAARLAEKNTRLSEEKEQLLQRLLTGQASGRDLGLAGEVSARSLQSKASLLQRFGFGGAKGSRKGSTRGKDDDMSSLASEPSSLADVHSMHHPISERPNTPPDVIVAEVIDECSRVTEQNKQLTARLAATKDLEEANQHLEDANQHLVQENRKLQDGIGLAKELRDDNQKLMVENRRVSDSVGVLIQENKELTNRLIDLALQNEDDIFDQAFGDSDDEQPQGAVQQKPKRRPSRSREDAPAVDTAQVQRRQQELAEQAAELERQQAAAAQRRQELQTKATQQLADYEHTRDTSGTAYKQARQSAMSRLQMFNRQVTAAAATAASQPSLEVPSDLSRDASPFPSPSPSSSAALPPMGPYATMTSPSLELPPDGFDEEDQAASRRREADLARAELTRKIQGIRGRQSQDPPAASQGSGAAGPDPTRRELESKRAAEAVTHKAEEQVRGAYFRYAGTEDVGSFMRSLGFPGFTATGPSSAAINNDFRRAIRTASEAAKSSGNPEQKALAESAQARLREWSTDYLAANP